MFCIVCRRHSTLLSPISAWPQASPVTSPVCSRSAPATHTGIPAETAAAAVRPALLDLKAQHKGKIVVSSPENNIPRRTHPRQIAKRSLSFPFSPVINAKNRLPRISRSASTSESDCSRGENNVGSEFRPHRPDGFLEFQTNCSVSSREPEFEQHSCPRSQLKFSTSTHNVSKKYMTMKEPQLTPSTVKEACQEESSCTKVKHATSVTAGRKYDVSVSSTSLTKLESSVTSLAACTISSPCSGGLSPFWPNSPIVLSSGSDKNPFVCDTPLKRDERTESKRRLSVNPGDNWPLNLSQSRDELSEKLTKQLTRRDEGADSTPRMILGSPFHALEEKPPRGTSLILENWNTASSFLSDKKALRSLRKAAAFQRGPKLHNSTESHNDLQTLDLKMSEPSNTVSSNLSNMGGDDSLDNEAMRTKLPQVQDDLQCVDMEISESPECPIILSQAFSCAPSEFLHDSWSSLPTNPMHLASGMTPFAVSATSGSSVDKHARHSMEISWPSNAANISELPLSDSGNSWKEDIKNSLQHVDDELSSAPNAGAFAIDSTLPNVDMFPKASGSREIVDPTDMDIADDVELLSNTLDFETDGTARPVPTKMAEVLGDYNANSSEETFSSNKVSTGSYRTENIVTGTSEDRVAEVSEKATSGITIDHFNTEVPNEKRTYSHLTSSLEQDIDGSVLNHLEKENPSACSLTNRKPVVFSLSPKKSTKIIARQLKTLQNAFAAETNCDQPSHCSSDDVRSTKLASVKSSSRKSNTAESNDCIGRIHSNESETMGESRDSTPLAVSCTAFEGDDTDFPEHAGAHLGGVIETSLLQDWGVTEDSLITADHDGSTEVYDLGSQADQTLEPIETWPVIDDCGFPDPEIVACSPLNSIETFTLRFPGESGFDEDEDEVNPRETKVTEEEAILVEERFLGFFMGPEVVICSDGTSEAIVTSSEEFDSGAFFPSKDNDEANLKTKGFQCEDSKTTDEMPPVGSVCTSPAEGLSEKLGFEDDFRISERLSPIPKQCIQTEHSTEGCSENVSQSLPSRSSNTDKYKHLIQSEEIVVSRKEEPVKGGVALPNVQQTGYPCDENLNTTPSNSMNIRDSYSEKRGVETSPGNEAEQRLREAHCPSKWTCSKEVNTGSRLAKNMTGRGEKLNLLSSSEFPTSVQGKTQSDNAFERGQELIFPNDLRDTRVDPQQEKKIPSCEELITLPKTCITDNVNVKRSSDNKQFTTALSEGRTSTTLSFPSPTQSSCKPQSNGINKATDFETTKNLPRKPVESSAEVATDGKPVAEIIGTVHLPRVTVTTSHLSNKPETGSQGSKTKESHRDSSDGDCQGKIEPLRNINDLQSDNRILNGKRKLVIEPEDIAKHRKLSTEPPPVPEKSREVDFGDNRLYRHYTERGQPEYGLAEYGRRYSGPHNMAPYLPAHLPVRSGERGGLPLVVPNDPHWYPPIGVTSQHRFEDIYPSSADCGRAIFAPIMYRARPMFSPPGTVPGPWQLPGYPCHVTYPLLGRR